MGYIIDLEKELEKRLSGLDEEKKNSLVKFVKQSVLWSFKNGEYSDAFRPPIPI